MIEICPHPQVSGFEDVEVVSGYCEIGCNCCKECHYDWEEDEEQKVNHIFDTFTPRGF